MSRPFSAEKIQQLFGQAAQRLQQGDALGARKDFDKLVKAIPQSAVVWYNLGLSHQHLNQHSKAVGAYKKALHRDANNSDAWVNLGLSQHALQQFDAAMQSTQAALKLAPQHPRALNLLGTLQAEQDQTEAAKAAWQQVLELAADNLDARHNLANLMLKSGDAAAALTLTEEAFKQPEVAKRHRELYAQILLDLKRFSDAAAVINALKAEFADDVDVLLLDMGRCELVKDYFGVLDRAQTLLALDAHNARVWNAQGSAYFQLNSVHKAAECYRQAIRLAPQHPQYQNNMGLVHSAKGDQCRAEACYRKALQLNPQYAEAYSNLVALKKFSELDDADAQTIQALWQQPDLDDFNRTKLAFALGKIYDDVGAYAQAFATYQRGNKLKFAEARLDFAQYFSHIDRVMEVFTQRPQCVSEVVSEQQPIFILGMPRSGTTLVEQIIARHPAVTGRGELPGIEIAISRLEKRAEPMRVYPQDFLHLDAEVFSQETEHYLEWVQRLHDAPPTAYFTDKMPFNFVHVWLIKALFPHAGIVHCHRHPLDVLTSNYFQLYSSDVSFVYDLEVMARYYLRYHRLMRHWQQMFEGEIYKIQYETLVGDKDAETRKLLAGVNLPWHDACLEQQKSDTAVRTASIWQVRQGIYTTSRERWRHYAHQLRPGIEVLQAEGVLDADLNYID